ncbi:MAG TPA: O-methyltransferase [Jatrophihabitantaceae bacterium]
MTQDVWTAVDHYFDAALAPNDAALDAALKASAAGGLPAIQVSAAQGKHLQLLARSVGARRILEVGTLGGYSTIWLARALPDDGQLISLEVDPRHAEVATANLANAGLADRTEVRVGPAIETLPQLDGPFDFAFIDADKASNADYFAHAVRLSRPGTLIVVDNVVRGGRVVDPDGDASVQGVRRLVDAVAAEPRVSATVIQTVGTKGYDGYLLAVVNR